MWGLTSNKPALLKLASVAALVAVLGPIGVAAQQISPMHFDRLSLDEGLSQSAVISILQDSTGFMWFATEDGLNRFDGYTFQHYKRERGNPYSLANDFVLDLAEDKDGNLWAATDGGGLAKWDRSTDRFTMFRHDADDANTIGSNLTRTVHIDAEGMIWVGTRNAGVDRVDPHSGVATHYRHDASDPSSLSSDEVYEIYADHTGQLWIGTNDGLNRLDPATGTVVRYQHQADDPRSLSGNRVRTVFEDAQGTVWVGTYRSGLNRFEGDGFTHFRHDAENPLSLSHDQVRAILEDDQGRLWIGTASGLNLLDRLNGRFVSYVNEAPNPNSLGDNFVMSLYQDRGGVLWVGTKSGGVSKWNPRTWALGHHTATPEDEQALDNPNVTSFAQNDDGTLWLGTFGSGLKLMDRDAGTVTHFRHDPAEAASLSDDRVMTVLHDDQGALWVGTMTGGLNRLDASGSLEIFRHDPENMQSLSGDGIMSLLQDRQGNLWVGTFGGGLNKFDRQAGSFTRFAVDPTGVTGLSSSRATALAEDDTGAVWIGTDGGGLNVLNPETGSFYSFRHDSQNPHGLSADTVYSLHVDEEGTVWVGTRGGGLDKVVGSALHPEQIVFENVSELDGLANDVIYGIRSDQHGQLWLSTNHGLSRLNPLTGEIKNFHRDHGLQSEEFNFNAHYVSAEGELFFGGPNGFNAFFPDQLETNQTPPAIALTSYDKSNRPVKSDVPYDRLDTIELGYQDDVVTFEFAALDFAAPEANQYAYMLEGFSEEWIELGADRRVTFTDLDDGRYVLRVKASNSDGVWNETGLSIDVRVTPAPWDTWWAYLIYALVALLLVSAPFVAQQRKLTREAEYAHRLEFAVRRRTGELAERNEQLAAANNKLLEASLTDPLTGLRNRRFLFEEASRDIDMIRRRHRDDESGVKRQDVSDLVFMMVDLDHFKPVNDTLGHAAGDQMLMQVRDVLLECCRSSDYVIRWGGDEFLVVARYADQEEAEKLAERIRATIAEKAFCMDDGQVARTTCSVGFACYPFVRSNPDLVSWEQVISLADSAMYEAKKTRNAWVGFMGTNKTAGSEGLPFESMQPTTYLFESIKQGRMEMRSSTEHDEQECA